MKKSKKTALKNVKVVSSKEATSFSLPAQVAPVAETPAALADRIPMKDEDASLIRAAENQILQTKLRLADLELQRVELVAAVRAQHNSLMEQVKKVAESYGIDVEGVKDTSKWNLDTAEMVFTRVTPTP